MANPKGKDEKNEWIEIHNNSNETIDLTGWKIKSSKKSTKIENKKIKKNQYILIRSSEINFSLKNTNETVTLVSPDNQNKETIKYKKSIQGESLSLTPQKNIKGKELKKKWKWNTPSPKKENISEYLINGYVKDRTNTNFIINNTKIQIPKKFQTKITETIIKNGKNINLIAEKKDNLFILKDYNPGKNYNTIKNKTLNPIKWQPLILQITFILVATVIYLYLII